MEWNQNPDETPPPVPPAAPSGLTASLAFDGTIGLSWSDNAFNESEFEVERMTALDPWKGVGRAPPDSVAFFDSLLAPVTEYVYRVRATNEFGASDWSDEATAASGVH